ncbi:hypothetical protein BV25DRAFT_1891862 [Artomyces pyxidatus]|uniref:Uncharacterized protein n=1 Tax=Artomyces pyxidatus TaxID=48021 RepID=A0ACB8SQ55_9AGAM|nr:hypothetical protein BV25DRAFT_1891862 [Artomyces pyxidatus]
MSLTAQENASKRSAALEQLRFKKKQKSSTTTSHSSSASSPYPAASSQTSSTMPPSQSRDATLSSRYFSSAPSPNGTVLVPNSSPLGSDSNYRPHYLSQPSSSRDVAAVPTPIPSNPWTQSTRQLAVDPLSAPSGFVTSGGPSNASFSRRAVGIIRGHSEVDGSESGEPPRKRFNHGPSSNDPMDLFSIPGSPEVQGPGQRRSLVTTSAIDRSANQSFSSDESMIESMGASSSNPRIVRGARPTARTPSDTPTAESDGPGFQLFRMTYPEFEEDKVRAAWRQAGRDSKAATALLQDPTFTPNLSSTSHPATAQTLPPITGRVKELDEATKAERAAAKEKGKKSLIYAARTALEPTASSRTVTPPAKSSASREVSSSLLSPTSPAVAIRRVRRPQRVIASDDEDDVIEIASDAESSQPKRRGSEEMTDERRALDYFNTTGPDGLQELTGCKVDQAQAIIQLRPFKSVADLKAKLGQGKKKAGPKGVSSRMFDDCVQIFEGYGAVDDVLAQCERIGAQLNVAIASWSSDSGKGKEKEGSEPASRQSRDTSVAIPGDVVEDGALSLRSLSVVAERKRKDFLTEQPKLLEQKVKLKEYQLLGVNWLRLLYRKGRSCILADEMGLGKTVQVISFFAHLKETGVKGPHLVVVPSSTLENWVREFARFAPSISVQTYYGGKEDRPILRQTLLDTQRSKVSKGWEVLITTYNLATGDDKDRKFFRRMEWDTCVFDEGHILKNFESQRYQALMRNKSGWRLLLTGTPLQNNLQELVSLMNFILPDLLTESLDSLRAVFKAKGDSKITLLAQERVSRAKKMMTPFVLRRRKDQVLKDLPNKTERIEWCDMTALQRKIYNEALQRSRKTIFDLETDTPGTETPPATNGRIKAIKKTKATARTKDKLYLENSSNVLMDLRKAASHPMLFRTQFTDKILDAVTKTLMKEHDFRIRDANPRFVKEDMEVMTDAELQAYLATYRSTQKFLQSEDCYMQAGKVEALLRLLGEYQAAGRRVLIFSQFTQILDILQAVFRHQSIKYLLLTGSTAVDVRQSLVDEFNEDESIPVFLLSTKAGGMGINLTAASVVILFDQDFNPHNDKQAQDRAYRIGQKRDVEVVKLITRGSIEEDMLRLGQTKLALDEAVAGDTDEGGGGENVERQMKTSLMGALRRQLADNVDGEDSTSTLTPAEDLDDDL